MIEESPEKSYCSAINKLEERLDKIRTEINHSSIPKGHEVRCLVSSLSSAIADLTAIKKKPTSSLNTSCVSDCSSTSKQVSLPKITLPTFYGDPTKWSTFWESFQAAVDTNDKLNPFHKLTYLREAIKDPKESQLLYSGTSTPTKYQELVELLIKRYDKKRLIHKNHSLTLINWSPVTKESRETFMKVLDTMNHALQGLAHLKQDDLQSFLTSVSVPKLPQKTQQAWLQYSKHVKEMPDVQMIFDFLQEKIDTLPDAPTTSSGAEPKPEHKRHQAPVHSVQSSPSRYRCSLCNGDRHSLYLCPSYKILNVEYRSSHVKTANLCFNCLGYRHKTRDCRSIATCKKCSRMHHTTLHRGSAPAANSKTTPPSDAVLVNTLSSKTAPQANLMMTSLVVLEAPSGKRLIARALLDSGAALSLVFNRAVQCLQLQKTPQQLTLSGVQGTTTGTSNYSVKLTLSPTQRYTCKLLS